MSLFLMPMMLIPFELEKNFLKAVFIGLVFNFFADIVIIPLYSFQGAAVTTVISEIIVWILCIRYIKLETNADFGFILIRRAAGILKRVFNRVRLRIIEKSGKNLQYYCPCCNTKFSKFTKVKYGKQPRYYDSKRYENIRQDVICPYCISLPRHRILVAYLQEHLEEIKNYSILHFAQEDSVRIWLDRNNVKYTTADLTRFVDLKLDIENTGLESNSIDMVICNHVLEHVTDYKKALNELKRIIKPEGKIIISFPVDLSYDDVYEDETITDKTGRIKAFGQYDHLRIFGKNSKEMLESFGFAVEEINGENYDKKIKPVIGPGDYDYNVLYLLKKNKLY